MGDRAQVKIMDGYDPKRAVFLYTHWGGTELLMVIHTAIKKGWRWNDGCYFTRHIFNEMQGEDRDETGFGIDTAEHGDIEHPLITLRPGPEQSIVVGDYVASFKDFVSDPAPAQKAYEGE